MVPEVDVAPFNVSQALFADAIHVSVPGPVLVTVRAWAPGLDPF
ncbi:hypothetical protein NITLEN_50165 [Nitrospira lenta]|uniref:Uncharacterized protein n=1 Tax=Nitrospira lenta TaxID=1436998 RepID=A0A330L873_9BACT|nr:hypothetical protein NITLEN_50165 [Nitrospira lenta]